MAFVRRTLAAASAPLQGPSRANVEFLEPERAERIHVVHRPTGVILLRTSDGRFSTNASSAKTPDAKPTNAVVHEALRPFLRERAGPHLSMRSAARAMLAEDFEIGVAAAGDFGGLPVALQPAPFGSPAPLFPPSPRLRRAPRRRRMVANAIGEAATAEDQRGRR